MIDPVLLHHAALLAAGDSTGGVPAANDIPGWLQIANVPLLGGFAYALFTGRIVSKSTHDAIVADLIEQRDRERDERLKAQEILTQQALPALHDSAEALKRSAAALERRRTTGQGR